MIGIFDSGIGGLTAVKAFDNVCPKCDIIYFGDTARVPYGTRSKDVITAYAMSDCRFLLSKKVDVILAACGTVSSNSLYELKKEFDIPIMGVVESAVRKAVDVAEKGNGRILVLGTAATVKSKAFDNEIRKISSETEIFSIACPLLVPLAENGRTSKDDTVAYTAVKEYVSDISETEPAAVILGCTHYPLFSDILSSLLPKSTLINTAEESASALIDLMNEKNIPVISEGKREFYVSDDPISFSQSALPFLGKDISDKVYKTDIGTF